MIDCDADECPGLARVSPIAKTRGKKREMARRKAQALWSLWSSQFGA